MAQLEFNGREAFAQPAADIFAKLVDLDFIAAGIPDLVSAEKRSDTKLDCRIRPGFTFIRGTLDVSMEILEADSPKHALMKVTGKGIGASLEIQTRMAVEPSESGTGCDIVWSSEVTQLGGLLRSVSKGLIQGAAAKVSGDIWGDLRRRLDSERPAVG